MQANDQASLDTRRRKDPTFTPQFLRDRWRREADQVGLRGPGWLDRRVCWQGARLGVLGEREVFARLADPEAGLCATDSRFGEAHVVAAVAAMSEGRWTVHEIEGLAQRFLASDLVVRIVPSGQRVGPVWSTVEHRQVEDQLLANIDTLIGRRRSGFAAPVIDAALDAGGRVLGKD